MAQAVAANQNYRVLYVDDEEANLKAFVRSFRFDFDILTAHHGDEALEKLKQNEIHLLITDQRMPGMTGLQLIKRAIKISPNSVRIILTAFSDTEVLLKAIQEGQVFDYILKPWRRQEVLNRLNRALGFYQSQVERLALLENRVTYAEQQIEEIQIEKKLVGLNNGLKNINSQIEKIAPTDSTVLIRGESGTGKELIAQTIHQASHRRLGPFIKVNASAFSEGVLESELFGHEKGSFTGAHVQKKGRFELAHRGTLFLDEIGDLPEIVQVKLLRVLQEREIERVGGHQAIPVDIRLITATHRPLELLVKEGKFRQDLFYRIHVIPIQVPPLRERSQDIVSLVEHFLKIFNQQFGKHISLTDEAIQALRQYSWPGNVRELRNVLERLAVLSDFQQQWDEIAIQQLLPASLAPETLPPLKSEGDIREQIQEQETLKLISLLEKTGGNLSEAARRLEIPRTTLYSRLKKFNLV